MRNPDPVFLFFLLSVFSLARHDEVDSSTLELLALACPQLQVLDLSRCPLVDDEGVASLLSQLPSLALLNLKKCPRLSRRMRTLLRHRVAHLSVQLE